MIWLLLNIFVKKLIKYDNQRTNGPVTFTEIEFHSVILSDLGQKSKNDLDLWNKCFSFYSFSLL